MEINAVINGGGGTLIDSFNAGCIATVAIYLLVMSCAISLNPFNFQNISSHYYCLNSSMQESKML